VARERRAEPSSPTRPPPPEASHANISTHRGMPSNHSRLGNRLHELSQRTRAVGQILKISFQIITSGANEREWVVVGYCIISCRWFRSARTTGNSLVKRPQRPASSAAPGSPGCQRMGGSIKARASICVLNIRTSSHPSTVHDDSTVPIPKFLPLEVSGKEAGIKTDVGIHAG